MSSRQSRKEEPIEVLDGLDQRIVAAIQIDGRASWREIAKLAGSSESTVARRVKALTAAGVIRSTATLDPVKCGLGYPVLLQLRCTPSKGHEVARSLAARPDVRFVTIVTGPFDVVAEVIVPSKRHLARFLFEEVANIEGVIHTSTETVVRNFKTAYDWSRRLLPDRVIPEQTMSYESLDSKPVDLDELDIKLAEQLREDGRAGYQQLAAALNITESMARRRVEVMVSTGALQPLTLVDPQLLGFEVEVFVWLQVDLSKLEEVARGLSARPEVRYLSATIGYSDLVGEVILGSQDDLYNFRMQTLGSMSGIRGLDMALELQTCKRAFVRLDD